MPDFQCRMDDESYEASDYTAEDVYDHEIAIDQYAEHCYNDRDGWEYMPNKSVIFFAREVGKEEEKKFAVYTEFSPDFSVREMDQP